MCDCVCESVLEIENYFYYELCEWSYNIYRESRGGKEYKIVFICLTICLVVGKQYGTCTYILKNESDSWKKMVK